jgi:hypothetical protein
MATGERATLLLFLSVRPPKLPCGALGFIKLAGAQSERKAGNIVHCLHLGSLADQGWLTIVNKRLLH